jgi:hypothetical protein
MKWQSESTIKGCFLLSRRIFWSFIVLFILAGIISAFTESYDLKWLEIFPPFIGGTSLILLVVSWTTPGIFVVLGTPWLAQAWLRGINPIVISAKQWDELSAGMKLLIYFWSIVISSFTLIATIGFLIYAER